ncbi:hypothetical protein BDB00DRAFT_544737 [Zychaea mexicana]|uniref:uncharacterized protein n=1 Tax=Zychaea mexicana TaxID=64656 RepID=UPI0022FE6E27|nr:uncharacterized protein BDB00DRAFT_544737 [Zychaea mexicana]KAI9497891.1 hypothetical protein BDB00DRAFT_544737 [Zychaea mexicana]
MNTHKGSNNWRNWPPDYKQDWMKEIERNKTSSITRNCHQKSGKIWKHLPSLNSKKASRYLDAISSSITGTRGQDQAQSTNSLSASSRGRQWKPIRPFKANIKMQNGPETQRGHQQNFFKASSTSSNEAAAQMMNEISKPLWKKQEDSPFVDLPLASSKNKKQEQQYRKHSGYQPMLDISKKKKTPPKIWHSIRQWSKELRKQDMSKDLYKQPLIQDEEDIIMEDSEVEVVPSEAVSTTAPLSDKKLFLAGAGAKQWFRPTRHPAPNKIKTNLQTESRPATLHQSGVWHSTWGPVRSFCELLATNDTPYMANICSSGGLQTTIQQITNAMVHEAELQDEPGSHVSGSSSTSVSTSKGDRGLTVTRAGVFINVFHDPRTVKGPPNIELSEDQSVFTSTTFQNGRHTSVTRFDRGQRFDLQDRFERRIYSGADPFRVPEVLVFRAQQLDLSIRVFAIWCRNLT